VPQDTDQDLLLFPLYVSGIYAGCFWYLLAPALHHICIRGNDAAEYLLSMCRRDGHIKAWGKKEVMNNKNTILYRCCKKGK